MRDLKQPLLKKAEASKLPPIPDKRYFTIGEVAELCAVKPHVLRYWEQEFSNLKPSKRRGNRRYYQYHDVLMVRQIRELLYERGFTIGGARLQLAHPSHSSTAIAPVAPPTQEKEAAVTTVSSASVTADMKGFVQDSITELQSILQTLQQTSKA